MFDFKNVIFCKITQEHNMLTTAPTNKLAPESLGSLQIYQYKHCFKVDFFFLSL